MTIAIGTSFRVNRLGFGAMHLGYADAEVATQVLRRVVELGVDFIDTADFYGPWVCEERIAAALHPYPDGLRIATKGGAQHDADGRWRADGSPEYLRSACEGSLRRLRLDQIPLYQLHVPDPTVPIEESVGALAALRAEGKVAEIGLSNVDVDQVRRAWTVAPIASVQNRYNVVDRSSEPVVELAEELGFAFLPWRPLGDGDADRSALQTVAARRGVTPTQAALAWQLARSPQILPIPGTSSVAHLEENVAAAAIHLSEDDLAEL